MTGTLVCLQLLHPHHDARPFGECPARIRMWSSLQCQDAAVSIKWSARKHMASPVQHVQHAQEVAHIISRSRLLPDLCSGHLSGLP
eukprot:406529-Pelagomonas_calceolata.AAC.4